LSPTLDSIFQTFPVTSDSTSTLLIASFSIGQT
jgi:hypothetical protein